MPRYKKKTGYHADLDFARACVAIHLEKDFGFSELDAVSTARGYTHDEAWKVVEELRVKQNELLLKQKQNRIGNRYGRTRQHY